MSINRARGESDYLLVGMAVFIVSNAPRWRGRVFGHVIGPHWPMKSRHYLPRLWHTFAYEDTLLFGHVICPHWTTKIRHYLLRRGKVVFIVPNAPRFRGRVGHVIGPHFPMKIMIMSALLNYFFS